MWELENSKNSLKKVYFKKIHLTKQPLLQFRGFQNPESFQENVKYVQTGEIELIYIAVTELYNVQF